MKIKTRNYLTFTIIFLLINFAFLQLVKAADSFDTIILSNEKVVGLAGTKFEIIASPTINNKGQIAFTAFIKGKNINDSNNNIIALIKDKKLEISFRTGTIHAGNNQLIAKHIANHKIADNNIISAIIQTGHKEEYALWKGPPGQIKPIVKSGFKILNRTKIMQCL